MKEQRKKDTKTLKGSGSSMGSSNPKTQGKQDDFFGGYGGDAVGAGFGGMPRETVRKDTRPQ